MDTRAIVKKAWQVTQVHLKKLIWYGAIPAFLSTIISSVYLGYQYRALKESTALHPEKTINLIEDVERIWGIISNHPTLVIAAIILAALIFGANFILSPILKGALIEALMKIKNYETISGSLEIGIRRFFPMLEFGLITGSFSIVTIFTESSYILRWWGQQVLLMALPILLFIATVGLIASFLFTYAEYFIVLKKESLIKSITESVVLVLANFRKTILIFILIMLIGARVILNVLLILFIPGMVVFLTAYFGNLFLNTVGLVIIGLASLLVLLVSAYLMGLFNVFATAVWVFSFAELTEKSED